MRSLCAYLTFLVLIGCCGLNSASATNIFFLPGDAVFHAALSEEGVVAIESGKALRFQYARPSYAEAYGCGFVGYRELECPDLSEEFRTHLAGACRELRKTYPRQIVTVESSDPLQQRTYESNPIHVLIYNATYDWKGDGLYLKFNEDWPTQAGQPGMAGFGGGYMGPQKARDYEPFLRDAKSLMREWRDAADIPRLDVTLPDNPKVDANGLIHTAAQLKGEGLFILIPKAADKAFSRIPRGTEAMAVRRSGRTLFEYRPRDGWAEVKNRE